MEAVNHDELLSPAELAAALKRSPRYIDYMKQRGFQMVGDRSTIQQALLFLEKVKHPCRKIETVESRH